MSTVKSLIDGWVTGPDSVPTLLSVGEERDVDDALVQARPDLFSEPVEPERPARKAREPRGGNG